MTVFGSGACRSDWVMREEWLTDGTAALMKDLPRQTAVLGFPSREDTGRGWPCGNLEEGAHQHPMCWSLTVDGPAPSTARNERRSPRVCGFLLERPQPTAAGTGAESRDAAARDAAAPDAPNGVERLWHRVTGRGGESPERQGELERELLSPERAPT